MSKPETVAAPHVYEAISKITGEMAKIGIAKTRKNKEQGYAFRGIDDVYAALSAKLPEADLVIIPRVISMIRETKLTKSGSNLNYTLLEVEFDFVSKRDGSKHTARMIGEAMDSADKSANKAMSAALKYCCIMVFMIPVEGEPDADETTHEETVPTPPPPAPRQKAPEHVKLGLNLYKSLDKAAQEGDEQAFHLLWTENTDLLETIRLDDKAIIKGAHLYEKLAALINVLNEKIQQKEGE